MKRIRLNEHVKINYKKVAKTVMARTNNLLPTVSGCRGGQGNEALVVVVVAGH